MKNTLLLIYCFLFIFSCKKATNEERYQEWYEQAKEKIIEESSLIADSTFKEVNHSDSSRFALHSFIGDQKLSLMYYQKDTIKASYHFSKNGRLKLVREYYTNHFWAFEGIRYDDKFYGPWTVRHAPEDKMNAKLPYKRREYRFAGKTVGKKVELPAIGQQKETFFHNWVDADSLPKIDNNE
jgi:hypothetical protein